MKHDIFISYKSQDFEKAKWLRNILENNRFSCWMAPQSIPGGSSYADEIDDAIRNCGVCVLVLSNKIQTSKWIKKEIDIALNMNKRVFPFAIEECTITGAFRFYLTDIQRYTAYIDVSDALKKMVNEINKELGRKISYVPTFSSYSEGEIIEFGYYNQNDSVLGKDSLKWRVLDKRDNALFLLCDNCIELQPLHYEKDVDITWEKCSLRRWLNNAFLKLSFSKEEQECILSSKIYNEPNIEHQTTAGNDTEDKIFLLSISEVEHYFPNKTERIAMPSEIVKMQYGDDCEKGINWWLRSPGYYHYRAAIVSMDGRVDYDGYSASRGNLAVRPAMWVANVKNAN